MAEADADEPSDAGRAISADSPRAPAYFTSAARDDRGSVGPRLALARRAHAPLIARVRDREQSTVAWVGKFAGRGVFLHVVPFNLGPPN